MESTREYLIGLGVIFSSDGRRRWPDDLKARIVAETLLTGAAVNDVAAKYGLKPNHVSSWRRMAKDGDLVLPVLEEEAAFAPLVVFEEPPALEVMPSTQPIEIAAGDLLIKLDGATPAVRIAEIVRALGVGS
ncbi:transposase [Ruegeria halocynthiae]|uniref:transposase n=1 Tax=Ruegeria halocynthiae TaxID=985054 RepID=UPI00055B4DF8|nr:transposase [Ruegeria halocynthiae]